MTDPNTRSGLRRSGNMIMPFVLVRSNGGKYEDESYIAGWALGSFNAKLELAHNINAIPDDIFTLTAYEPQLDLMAMRFGFMFERDAMEDKPGWSKYSFRKVRR